MLYDEAVSNYSYYFQHIKNSSTVTHRLVIFAGGVVSQLSLYPQPTMNTEHEITSPIGSPTLTESSPKLRKQASRIETRHENRALQSCIQRRELIRR